MNCPDCQSDDVTFELYLFGGIRKYRCQDCGGAFGKW